MIATAEKQRYLRHMEQFDKQRRSAPFANVRQAARARLRDLGFPTPKTEDWRFTSVAGLLKVPFELAPETSLTANNLPPLPTPGATRLVFVNGVFAPALGNQGAASAGIELGSLAAAKGATADRLERVLNQAGDKGQVFTALNTSFLSDGAYIIVPDGKQIEEPIEVIYLSMPGSQATVTYPRTIVITSRGSQVTLVERYLGASHSSPLAPNFTNAVTEIALEADAIVDHYKLQQENLEAYHIASTQVAQARASRFTTHYLSFGGSLVRNEVRVRFDDEGGEATVNGLYLGSGTQHIDNFTVIDHAKPNCNSHELYKGIFDEQAHGVFNGKIFVRPDAQKTDAKQTNKVLLLSDSATINTKPQLEIFADDVKCTHGATVGRLDAESIFYLRSRGIGLAEARALLTFAFANDILGRIKIEAIRADLEQRVMAQKDTP